LTVGIANSQFGIYRIVCAGVWGIYEAGIVRVGLVNDLVEVAPNSLTYSDEDTPADLCMRFEHFKILLEQAAVG